jgi:hypothetical protein
MNNRLGLDWWDVLIHVFVTVCTAVVFSEGLHAQEDVALPMIFGSSAVLFAIRRKLALKKLAATEGLSTGEMAAERIADLEARVADLEIAQGRVAELEERMDFSERLLTQQSHESRVASPEIAPLKPGDPRHGAGWSRDS